MSVAPLVISDDDLLLDELMRLAAAAGVRPTVARDVPTALRHWHAAAVVLVADDLAMSLAETMPPRRERVQMISRAPVPDAMFRVAVALGAETVAELPASQEWLVELLTDAGDGGSPPAVVVGVLGGSGGAGATVFAAALARVLGDQGRTLLIDCDALGPGADRVLGMESVPGVRWDQLHSVTGRLSSRALRESLPRRDDLTVLSWAGERPAALQPFAVREVLSAGVRGHDHVVLDLPRHPDQVVAEVLTRCDHLVLLCGVTVPAVSAAAWAARRLKESGARCHLVVRGRGGVQPGEISRVLAVPLVAAMPDQRGLDEALDLGAGPMRFGRGVLARAAREVARVVAAPVGQAA